MYGITEVRINLNRFKEATLGINHVEIREQGSDAKLCNVWAIIDVVTMYPRTGLHGNVFIQVQTNRIHS